MLLKLFILSIAIIICSSDFSDSETSLKCWRCSSNISSANFCDDPFNPNVLSNLEKRWIYVQCPHPPNYLNRNGQAYNFIPVCKKATLRNVDGTRVIARSCHWVNNETPKGECLRTVTESNVVTESCETCRTDGCNGF
ncbi:uncharacterized protein LOC119072764 [Bradysia coprophila]|uniref:uncharacterized protein LOC119072764 n=1 Tax=Bradysia coprophila TaxID=38358 RepID=UPI00187D9A14|nr:uncharacterized protein LOC119072764 [Bradysia coprophila]